MKKIFLVIGLSLGSIAHIAWSDTLIDVYNEARRSDPSLLSAEAKKKAAHEAIHSMRSTLLPQVDLLSDYSLSFNGSNREESRFTGSALLKQVVYDQSGWIKLDTAEKQARKADAEYAVAQQELILHVAEAYFGVLRAKHNLKYIKSEKSALGRRLVHAKEKFAAGLSEIIDVSNAQAQYDSALAHEVSAESIVVNRYGAVREMTGVVHGDLKELDNERFLSMQTDQPRDLINAAQKSNFSLLSARISQEIARDGIKLANSAHGPTVLLSIGYSYHNGGKSGTDSNHSLSDSEQSCVGISVSLPLYKGGKVLSNSRQAEFELMEADQAMERASRGVVRKIQAYQNDINTSLSAIKAYSQAALSANSVLEATKSRFEVGMRTDLDVLDAIRRAYDAERQFSDVCYSYVIALLNLKASIGILNQQDFFEVDASVADR